MLAVLAAAAAASAGAGELAKPAYPTDAELRAILQPVAEQTAKKWNCSYGIAFRGSGGRAVEVAAGDSTGFGRPTQTTDPYVWGSVTKMLTGTTVLQQIEKGEIGFNTSVTSIVDPVLAQISVNISNLEELWGPEVHNVTVYHLLHMQSGIPDFDTATPGKQMSDSFRQYIYDHPHEAFSPWQLMGVRWVRTGKLLFTPGNHTAYSSTNFMLLGVIAASLQGVVQWDSFDQKTAFPPAVAKQFAATHFGVHGAPSSFTHVRGYDRTHYNNQTGLGLGVSVFDTEGVFAGWTASDIVAPVADIGNMVYQIYGPESPLLSKKYQELMVPHAPFYGCATFNLTFTTGDFARSQDLGTAYGHLGATYGYQSIASYHPALDFSLAIATNIETDFQQQPAEALCLAYNYIMANMTGQQLGCQYVTKSGYWGGSCNCTAA